MTNTLTGSYITINWDDIPGAKSYDLEWTWVDTELKSGVVEEYDFKSNSSRVNTNDNSYRISNNYREGAIVARVRARGNCDENLIGIWSLGNSGVLTSGTHVYVEGHREDFNWQHSKTFAEEGKHKDVISYFDGSMRSRQSVTKIESETNKNAAIIAESYYDHVGRPTIQALPSPMPIDIVNYATDIDYYDAFNTQGMLRIPYSHKNFEADNGSCDPVADPMNNADGSSKYFSPTNPIKDNHQAYVPDAEGYPFSQTIYTQDPTGRVRVQGGVGPTHQASSIHSTKYFYGVPEQFEIDRLFGNDAGYAEYYEKNLVVDANGQVSVSYLDNKGRVVATALDGNKPTQLDALSNQTTPISYTSPLGPLNNMTGKADRSAEWSIHKLLTSSRLTNYTFDYTFTPQDFTDLTCAPTICFDCSYEVKMVIYDDCGNVVAGNETPSAIRPGTIDGNCESNGTYTDQLSANLDIGEYNLYKKLSLNQEDMDACEERYVEAYTCIGNEVMIFDSLFMRADFSGCVNTDCIMQCTTEIQASNYTDLDLYIEDLSNCIDSKIANGDCDELIVEDLTDCDAFRLMLVADMSPTGQYGVRFDANNEIIPQRDLPCTSFYANAALNVFGQSYNTIDYGGITINIDGEDLSPNQLSLTQFLHFFDETWIEFILPFHPEFPYLDWCESHPNSDEFDRAFLSVTTFDEANALGYLNPLGSANPGYGITTTNPVSGAFLDGLLTTDIESQMQMFTPITQGPCIETYTIWDLAYMSALSNIYDISQIIKDDCPAPGTWHTYGPAVCHSDRFWLAFQSLYMSLKKRYTQIEIDNRVVTNVIIDNDCFGSAMGTTCAGCDAWQDIQQRYYDLNDLGTVDGNGNFTNINGELTGGLDISAILNSSTPQQEADTRTEDLLEEQCTTTCQAYEEDWKAALSQCGLTTAEMDVLIAEMVAICVNGCDISHPLGSSSRATDIPGGPNNFREALITAVGLGPGGQILTKVCNDLLIDMPLPYGNDIFAGTQAYIDDCVCSRYQDIYNDYSVGTSNPDFNGFYTWLQTAYNFDLSKESIIDLDCACNATDPTRLETPISSLPIPPPFACQECIDCVQAMELYEEFRTTEYAKYYSYIDSDQLEDPLFRSILTNWFNSRLNFNLSFDEYIDFFNSCGFGVGPVPGGGGGGETRSTNSSVLQLADSASIGDISATPSLAPNTTAPSDDTNPRPQYRMASDPGLPPITLTLSVDRKYVTPGTTISYEFIMTNTGAVNETFDLEDQLPAKFTFLTLPTNLSGGTLNTSLPSGFLDVTGITLAPGASLTWNLDVEISANVYLTSDYPNQAAITTSQSQTPDVLSDDPETTPSPDPTVVFVKVGDPCQQQNEQPEDLVELFNDLIDNHANYFTSGQQRILVNPFNQLTSFSATSSLNLWPHIDNNNLYLKTLTDFGTAPLSIEIGNSCLHQTGYCEIQLENIGHFTDLSEVLEASYTGLVHDNGFYIIDLDVILADGTNTTIRMFSSCYSLIPCEERTLCNRSITFETTVEDNCLDYMFDLLAYQTNERQETFYNDAREKFRVGYSLQCMGTPDELDQTFDKGEYHHTLYYYDQSGSLVRTVPPNGVNPLDQTGLIAVEAYRNDPYNPSIDAEFPAHSFRTNYKYNSYNSVIEQNTPDTEISQFFYDELGRVVVSQDGRQAKVEDYLATDPVTSSTFRYSYTRYDEQGRIIEVGEIVKESTKPMTDVIAADQEELDKWLAYPTSGPNGNPSGTIDKVQVVRTFYDNNLDEGGLDIDNLFEMDYDRPYLRKRVSSVLFYERYNEDVMTEYLYNRASHYDYDVHGNVKTLLQEFKSLEDINQSIKRIDYDYDLISGNVNMVSYQDGQADAFYHRYRYDADNRLIDVETSRDRRLWDRDASYTYYDHGPLARTVIGDVLKEVQGCDYAYTIHGWIKGVNSNTLEPDRDMGKDGFASSNVNFPPDAYGYSLGYYKDDYKAIDNSINTTDYWLASEINGLGDLYNGNIRSMVTSLRKPDGTLEDLTPSVYTYDQLHRIKKMRKFLPINIAQNTWVNAGNNSYETEYTYDPNGNLETLTRRDATQLIDDLHYDYPLGGNQLQRVRDNAGQIDKDFAGHPTTEPENYEYDGTGNLVEDKVENIDQINWNVYGKVKSVIHTTGTDLSVQPNIYFDYDAAGNRTIKKVEKGPNGSDWEYTYYVRDASGNVMAVYEAKDPTTINSTSIDELYEKEHHLYGSSRLGLKISDIMTENLATYNRTAGVYNRTAGTRYYELSNHLGNVLSVISDNLLLSYGSTGTPKYKNEILRYSDYYPFGMEMPGRMEVNPLSENYRYGFNGKEKDEEGEFGTQTHYDYGFRIYNPGIGKFLSVDPLTASYPWYTPYQFAGNKPIQAIDLDGLEEYEVTGEDGQKYGSSIPPEDIPVVTGQGPTQGCYKKNSCGGVAIPTQRYHEGNDLAKEGFYSRREYTAINLDYQGGQVLPAKTVIGTTLDWAFYEGMGSEDPSGNRSWYGWEVDGDGYLTGDRSLIYHQMGGEGFAKILKELMKKHKRGVGRKGNYYVYYASQNYHTKAFGTYIGKALQGVNERYGKAVAEKIRASVFNILQNKPIPYNGVALGVEQRFAEVINLALGGVNKKGNVFSALSNVKNAAVKDIYLEAADAWIKLNLKADWKKTIIKEVTGK